MLGFLLSRKGKNMRMLETPFELSCKGVSWPKIVLVGPRERPPEGIPYLRWDESSDKLLVFRLMLPMLEKKFTFFRWREVFTDLTGEKYTPVKLSYKIPDEDVGNNSYDKSTEGICDKTLKELAMDTGSSVDMDLLLKMKLVPKFFGELADVIKVNLTNSYQWTDGYNKKLGICCGYLEERPRKRSLVILDISASIPDGLSAGMMTLIKTITDITSADLILTGGISKFYTNEEVLKMDIDEERRSIPRSNESTCFRKILKTHNMDYDVVISFGDSDNPGTIKLDKKINTKHLYDFFIGKWDVYGSSYMNGTGYARWVTENKPNVQIHRCYDWARLFRA